MSDADVPGFDPESRPRLAGDRDVAELDAMSPAGGQVLVAIHDHLRAELEQVRRAVAAVCSDTGDVDATAAGDARALINRMTMRANYWQVGAFCAAYCRILSVHHAIEDEHMFTQLRTGDRGLGPVLDRLSEEHHVIAGLLDRLDRSLMALMRPGPPETGAAAEAQAAVDALAEVLLSHLTYEEEELVGPLGRLGILV